MGRTWHSGRSEATNPVIIALLTAILLAIVVLIVVVVQRGRNGGGGGSSGGGGSVAGGSNESKSGIEPKQDIVKPGEVVGQNSLPRPPEKPKLIGDEERIRDVAQVGKTYEIVAKGGFTARVEDKDWGLKQVVSLAYAFDMSATRKIESNDGKTIVELRHFQNARATKLLTTVESVTIELGLPGVLALVALDQLIPGAAEQAIEFKPIAESILKIGAQSAANSKETKAFGKADSLQGKTIRITYKDGVGVDAIEPVDCSLSADERDFLFNTACLSDYYTMPDPNVAQGKTWTVSGHEIMGLLDPSMRGVPSGEITIRREKNFDEDQKHYAQLGITAGKITIDASDDSSSRIGSFVPNGKLRYNISDGYVELAELTGTLSVSKVSKNHILFKATFQTKPKLQLSYSCRLRDSK